MCIVGTTGCPGLCLLADTSRQPTNMWLVGSLVFIYTHMREIHMKHIIYSGICDLTWFPISVACKVKAQFNNLSWQHITHLAGFGAIKIHMNIRAKLSSCENNTESCGWGVSINQSIKSVSQSVWQSCCSLAINQTLRVIIPHICFITPLYYTVGQNLWGCLSDEKRFKEVFINNMNINQGKFS